MEKKSHTFGIHTSVPNPPPFVALDFFSPTFFKKINNNMYPP